MIFQKVILLPFFLLGLMIHAQTSFNPHIDKDSLFESIVNSYPDHQIKKMMQETYSKANTDDGKEYLLAVLYDSNYTKQNLIDNYEKNKTEISKLVSEYSKLVPKDLIVETTIFTNKIFVPEKIISLQIYKIKKGYINNSVLDNKSNLELISDHHNLSYGTDNLKEILKTVNWTENTLKSIEQKLNNVNAISIRNGEPSLVKYKRTGLAFLSYKIFNKELSDQQILENNDGCNHIYYKNNIVLVSDNGQDGARGVLCFP